MQVGFLALVWCPGRRGLPGPCRIRGTDSARIPKEDDLPKPPEPLAPHVQAAIARSVAQAKPGDGPRPRAAHVEAALGRGPAGQPRRAAASPRAVAAHVQAATGRSAVGQPRAAPGSRALAPHVAAALGGAARVTPAVQARQAGAPHPPAAARRRSPAVRQAVLQRALEYVEERNEGDIEEAKKWFKTIKRDVQQTEEPTPYGMFTIWTVSLNALPHKVRELIAEIRGTDFSSDDRWSLYPRDFHTNTGGHLPETDPAPLGQQQGTKGAVFYGWSAVDHSHRVDVRGRPSQYAEYHITESGLGKAFRLLYDYVNDVFYVSLSHYNIWDDERPPFFRVV